MDLVYKDCIIVYKSGKGIVLRATKMTVINKDNVILVYDGDVIMAVVPLSEIKTVMFCEASNAAKLCEAISGVCNNAKL